jgi:predicted hotdog family 3-hydroxylacyl-ACP dehydratase
MAQTIGAYVTLERREREGAPAVPRLGYLVSAQSVRFHVSELELGRPLRSHAKLEWHDEGLARFWCNVGSGDRELGDGRLTVYERPRREPR